MGILHLIWMVIVGFIVGAINMGFWATALLGIIGSLVGGVIGGILWRSPDGKFHPAGWILSLVGALIVLWLYLTYVAR